MVIGSGLIATQFKPYEYNYDIVIFASGISNSQETSLNEFNRERKMLEDTISQYQNKHIVYFSTCSIYDSSLLDSMYVKHKKKMEMIIAQSARSYNIFRLPQVVGYSNNNTFINYMFRAICSESKIYIHKNSTRNLISINDVFIFTDFIIKNKLYHNKTINIASPFNLSIYHIVSMLETITSKNAKCMFVDKGCSVNIPIDALSQIELFYQIFKDDYTYTILDNYFLRYKQHIIL